MKTNATNFAKIGIGLAALLASGISVVTNAIASENLTSAKEKRGSLLLMGITTEAAAMSENNSSLAPLTWPL